MYTKIRCVPTIAVGEDESGLLSTGLWIHLLQENPFATFKFLPPNCKKFCVQKWQVLIVSFSFAYFVVSGA